MSDAFSPIMTAGALVFPDVMVGMIEASATRRALHSPDPQPVVDDGCRIAAHLTCPDRMINGLCDAPRPFQQFIVRLRVRTGANFFRDIGGQGFGFDHFSGEFQGIDRRPAVQVSAQIIRLDNGMGEGVVRGQANVPPAFRAQLTDGQGKGGKAVCTFAGAVRAPGLHMVLDVRCFQFGPGAGKDRDLAGPHGQGAGPFKRKFQPHQNLLDRIAGLIVERDGPVRAVDRAQLQMVL